MVLLESIADVVYEPWIDHVLLKILGPKGHAFLQNPNTVLTPHIGVATYDTETNYFQMIAERPRKSLIGRDTALHRESRGAGIGRGEARRNELFGALGRASELAVCAAADNGSQSRGSCLKQSQ